MDAVIIHGMADSLGEKTHTTEYNYTIPTGYETNEMERTRTK